MQATHEILNGRRFTVLFEGATEIYLLEENAFIPNTPGCWFPRGWIFHSRRDAANLTRKDEGKDCFAHRDLKARACREGLADFGAEFAESDWEFALEECETEIDKGDVIGEGAICIDSGQAEIIPLDKLHPMKSACDQRENTLAQIRVQDDGLHRVKLVDGPTDLCPSAISKGANNGARVHARCEHWLPAGDYAVADSGCGVFIRHAGGYFKSFMVNRTLYLVAEGLKQL